MSEKDTISKTLESYDDVFADIVNGFLFDGDQVVSPEELTPADISSQYKADGQIRPQERDVSKYWRNCSINIAYFGLENQSAPDKYMPMRVINYDGAAYRKQLNEENDKHSNGLYHPVITLVLYFGDRPWNYGAQLCDCLDIPERLRPFVSDYKVNLIDLHKLTEDDTKRFGSDFREIISFYAARNTGSEYIPSDKVLAHPRELAEFFSVFQNDERFIDAYNKAIEEAEEITMCEYVDRLEARGEARGRAEGRAEGEAKGRAEGEAKGRAEGEAKGRAEGEANMIKRLYDLGNTVKQISELFKMPEKKVEEYLAMKA